MADEYDIAYQDGPPRGDEPPPRDPRTDEAKEVLVACINANANDVWYERQLVVMFEQARRARPYFNGEGFFHWITVRALDELIAERRVGSRLVPLLEPVTDAALRQQGDLVGGPRIRFFWRRGNRYVTRRAEAIRKLVMGFSEVECGRGLGRQGELMFDAALPTKGFMPKAWNTRAWAGREWLKTDHNLDRVFERDGIAYGTEIKNTLIYMPAEEMKVKLEMCEHLGLTPVFVVRMAPKSYIEEARRHGGYTLVFEWQQYPYAAEAFAQRVRAALHLPVDCWARIEDGTIQRLLNWHKAKHGLEA